MKKIIFCLLLLVFLFSSCVGSVQLKKLQPKVKFSTPVILNLKNYGDNDVDFFRRSERLIRGKLISASGEEFGYYHFSFMTVTSENDLLPVLHSILFPLIPLGFPTHSADISVYEWLYIFDSEGNLVKKYGQNDKFTQVAGLYYGRNPTRRVAKTIAKMTDKIFEMALLQSEEINQALKKKGPITEENKNVALKKIYDYLYPKRPESSTSSPTIPSSSSSSSNKPELKIGAYACSGTNYKMSLSYGTVTLSEGYKTIAMGTYKISGNQLVITFSYGIRYGKSVQGMTYSYTISDSKNFYSGNERWSYTGF